MPTSDKKRYNWGHELALFEASRLATRTFKLTTPNVAQVTRHRIVTGFDTPVTVRTRGASMVFSK